MARITVKNEGVSFDIPDGARLLHYLWENTAFPQGCENGTASVCACVILKGAENLNPKTHQETVTLDNAGMPNSPRNRLACQLMVSKGEVVLEY